MDQVNGYHQQLACDTTIRSEYQGGLHLVEIKLKNAEPSKLYRGPDRTSEGDGGTLKPFWFWMSSCPA